jgi:tetratricopeptide (TPR) repeat protein
LRRRNVLPVLFFLLLSFACSAKRPELAPPSPPRLRPEVAELLEAGDRCLRQHHLYGWRRAEASYERAHDLANEGTHDFANDTEIRHRLALTRFLIISRELDEGIFSDRHLDRFSALCSPASSPSPYRTTLCRAAGVKLRLARVLDAAPVGFQYYPTLPAARSDEPELDEYVALLIAKDSAPSSYPEEVERFRRSFPESLLAAYLKIRQEGVSAMDVAAMETDSEFAELHFARGSSLLDDERFQQGGDLLHLGLTLIPDHTPALIRLAGTYLFSLGLPRWALEFYDRALESDPRRVEALFGRAAALHSLGEYVESNRMVEKMIDTGLSRWRTVPGSHRAYYRGQAHYLKALNLYLLGYPKESRRWIDLALGDQPHSETARYLSGLLHFDANRHDESKRELLLVVDGGTEICDAYYRLGLLAEDVDGTLLHFTNNGICLERSAGLAETRMRKVGELDLDPTTKESLTRGRRLELRRLRAEALSSVSAMLEKTRDFPGENSKIFADTMTARAARLRAVGTDSLAAP